jgi:hypothetical protein
MSASSGAAQVAKLSQAEATYGETIAVPSYAVVGIVTGGDIGSKTSFTKIRGIGSVAPQGKYPGKVENSLKLDITAPGATVLNKGIVRTDGVLASYNFVAGVGTTAWRGVGLKANSVDLDIDDENPLKASFDCIFRSLLPATVDASGHDPSDPPIWRRDGLVLTIGGVEDTDLVSCKISVKNNLTGKGINNTTTNQKRIIGVLEEGDQEIDVTIQTYSAPTFNLEADGYGCGTGDVTLVATFTDLCGGATPDTLVITLTGGVYLEKRQPLKPNEYVDYSIGMSFDTITIA